MQKRVGSVVRDSPFKLEKMGRFFFLLFEIVPLNLKHGSVFLFIVRDSPFKLETCQHDIWVLPWARPLFLQSKCKNYVFLKFLLLLSFKLHLYEYIKTAHGKLRFPYPATPEMELFGHQFDKRLESFALCYSQIQIQKVHAKIPQTRKLVSIRNQHFL